jgi:hypothetical protein
MYWWGLASIALLGLYFHCYTALISRIQERHPVLWSSLGQPTAFDSNFSANFQRMSGFILHLQFLRVPDQHVRVLGFVVFSVNIAGIVTVIAGALKAQ